MVLTNNKVNCIDDNLDNDLDNDQTTQDDANSEQGGSTGSARSAKLRSDSGHTRKYLDNSLSGNVNSRMNNSGPNGTTNHQQHHQPQQTPQDIAPMLDSSKIRKLMPYFNYSSVVSHAIQEHFDGKIRGKLEPERAFYDNILRYFVYMYAVRNLLLTFIEDIELRAWLGESERVRPQRQMVMVFTIWSVYIAINLRNLRTTAIKKNPLSWLDPFQVLRGEATPHSYGLNHEMLHTWHKYTLSMWRFYLVFSSITIGIVSLYFIGLVRHRWNTYEIVGHRNWYNWIQAFWSTVSVVWAYLCATHTFVCFVYFNTLCYYFKMRYEKVNRDIEVIISQRLKANERVAMLHHILVEHNNLCLKVSEYNKFWARYLMATYFFLIAVICFTSFQAFFTANLIIIRLVMFICTLLASFIITRISISAAIMSNMAHAPYNRLIRVTFEKYPVELQIQLRMFIQRTSGPTIGFYCLDVFEITYTTYASILAALGQNFLLIVDFVRSYAEVGREYDELSFSQFNMLTESVFNSTLDVLDEMTGTHLSSTLHSGNTSLISLIKN